MEGVLLIDKPKGPTSFQVIRKVRGITKIKKVGHAGTLDPLASGLLIVCLGKYTKKAQTFTDGHKIYEATFRLGETSATDDAESEPIKGGVIDHLSIEAINLALSAFVGVIEQVPPQFSAVKVNGKRAYAIARNDGVALLSPRKIEIFAIEILSYSAPDLAVRIHCTKGTYVRSLARDLGKALGVGAYAADIRRIRSGDFLVNDAIKLEDLDAKTLASFLRTTAE